jgi:hypothetical protein
MKAHVARFGVTLLSLALAAGVWLALLPSWTAWVAAPAVFLVGGVIAEAMFRRLATPEMIRADLEDRVRNPPP